MKLSKRFLLRSYVTGTGMIERDKSYLEFIKGIAGKENCKEAGLQGKSKAVEFDTLKKAQEAYRIFFSANRSSISHKHKKVLEQSKQDSISVNGNRVNVYSWGYGPRVLLVHGIDGYGGQLSRFVDPLLTRGFSITAFDAPGHGQSEGSGANADDVEKVFKALEKNVGPFESIIAHSIGCIWSLWSISQGVNINDIVCISPPATQSFLINTFVKIMKLTDEVEERFMYLLKEAWGDDMVEKFSAVNLVKSVNARALIIHGDKDDMIPMSKGGQKLHDAWVGSELMIAQELGHNNILSDQSVIDRTIDFLTCYSASKGHCAKVRKSDELT